MAIVLGSVLDGIPESFVLGLTVLQGGESVPLLAGVALSNLPEGLQHRRLPALRLRADRRHRRGAVRAASLKTARLGTGCPDGRCPRPGLSPGRHRWHAGRGHLHELGGDLPAAAEAYVEAARRATGRRRARPYGPFDRPRAGVDTVEHMTIQRLENVGIVVEHLEADRTTHPAGVRCRSYRRVH
jgi:hypothetical protein